MAPASITNETNTSAGRRDNGQHLELNDGGGEVSDGDAVLSVGGGEVKEGEKNTESSSSSKTEITDEEREKREESGKTETADTIVKTQAFIQEMEAAYNKLRAESTQIYTAYLAAISEAKRADDELTHWEEHEVTSSLVREMQQTHAAAHGRTRRSDDAEDTPQHLIRSRLRRTFAGLNKQHIQRMYEAIQEDLSCFTPVDELLAMSPEQWPDEWPSDTPANRKHGKRVRNPDCTTGDGVEYDKMLMTQEQTEENGSEAPGCYLHMDVSTLLDSLQQPEKEVAEYFFVHSKELLLHAAARKYQSTVAHLLLQIGDCKRVVRSVVDSGAAWCAINASFMKKHFPDANIRASNKRFKDASNNVMNLAGETTIQFNVGALELSTTAFVFNGLGADFLLGTNALAENGLSISLMRNVLFSELKVDPSNTQPIFTHRDAEPELKATTQCGCSQRSLHLTYDSDISCIQLAREGTAVGQTDKMIEEAGPNVYTIRNETPPLELYVQGKHIVPAGTKAPIKLSYGCRVKGEEQSVRVSTASEFLSKHSRKNVSFTTDQYHSSANLHAMLIVNNQSEEPLTIESGELAGTGRVEPKDTAKSANNLKLRVEVERRASPLTWKCIGPKPPSSRILCSDGWHSQVAGREFNATLLWDLLPERQLLTEEEVQRADLGPVYLTSFIRGRDDMYYMPTTELPYAQGGRPLCKEDLHDLGFDLTRAIDPSLPKDEKGNYPPLSDKKKDALYDAALLFWHVWSRNARTPELSRLIVLEIPTGNSEPIAQRPYPMPYRYLEAVRKEVQALLDGGLIEPCISNWASPALIRLKKDSTPENVRLKIIIDYRRLNEVTIPDVAGLGDQDEILDGFGGDQRYCGIVDAAGGFYQFLIHPRDRHKSAFVLPTSMGGTSFQWRVAPYGLTRNPAGYSRGMMFALKGLDECLLDGGRATGGAKSWIDDVSMHANTFEGFVDLFSNVLERLAFAGMSLKASKCLLLHQQLEVLGFYVTPDGLIMQQSKIDALVQRNEKGELPYPSNVAEIRTFLGAVQFYRRFVPRISLLAAPMNSVLKGMKPGDARFIPGTPEHTTTWDGVKQSFEAIIHFLNSSAVMSAPDLHDPLAEYVLCPDACDIAGGGSILQWQWPDPGFGPGPPPGVPLRGIKGSDPIQQSWRIKAGWKLRTIGHHSKTFGPAEFNYPTFDKEALAIIILIRRYAKLVTCHPTTVYTDSAVAATMLTKHLGPPRLQRWGMELGTFLPYLKIQYRKGVDNGLGDFVSRWPTFAKYVECTQPSSEPLPSSHFQEVATVRFHAEQDLDSHPWLKGWAFTLYEAKDANEVTDIWQAQLALHEVPTDRLDYDQLMAIAKSPRTAEVLDIARRLPDVAHASSSAGTAEHILQMLAAIDHYAGEEDFMAERALFESHMSHWERYVDIFDTTLERSAVIYDLCCGEGGYSRGARHSGLACIGFDNQPLHRKRYENDYQDGGPPTPSGMKFIQADVFTDSFWEALEDKFRSHASTSDIALPDMIHVSPPCHWYSRLNIKRTVTPEQLTAYRDIINWLVDRLRRLEGVAAENGHGPLLWEIESVPESEAYVTTPVTSVTRLCGTMMGHRVFRHRVFYCNYHAITDLKCNHRGKWVGSHGVHHTAARNAPKFDHLPEPNMYGVYSKPYASRGTSAEWHQAMGFAAGTYSNRGLAGALPMGYGRLLSSQMVARYMEKRFGCPVYPFDKLSDLNDDALKRWERHGYRALNELHFLGILEPEKHTEAEELVLPVIADTTTEVTHEDEEATTGTGDFDITGPFNISRNDQLEDPRFSLLINRLEKGMGSRHVAWAALKSQWALRSGLLYNLEIADDGTVKHRLAVPPKKRAGLLAYFHYLNHRGHGPLDKQLKASYFWENMESDCTDFTRSCQTCQQRQSRPLGVAPTGTIATPSRPFSVIHVDHKGKLPTDKADGVKYNHILVVVCALTRFTLFIPATGTTAAETLRLLNREIFGVFGYPAVIVSDNGPAFIGDMNEAMSNFLGYRHVHILPYNSQANGTAEASVKRIKLLLDRQTSNYREWCKLLPTLQLMLNATVHTGTGLSPYVALFGHEPNGLEQLENPALYPEPSDGNAFMRLLKQRQILVHAALKEHSDAIKKARIEEDNKRLASNVANSRHGTIAASTPTEDRFVWVIHGSKDNATYLRKHGHGQAWQHKYKVLEVRPHAVRVEVPRDRSVPIVQEWQLIRRVRPASPGDHAPDHTTQPIITGTGILAPSAVGTHIPGVTPSGVNDVGQAVSTDDQNLECEIDSVQHAERVQGKYRIYIKWKGYSEVSWMWRADLLRQPLNEELLADIERAVSAERSRAQVVAPDTYDEAEEDDVEVEDYAGAADAPAAPLFLGDGRRPGRVRAQAVQHNVGQFLLSTTDVAEMHSSRAIKLRRIQALQGIRMLVDIDDSYLLTGG